MNCGVSISGRPLGNKKKHAIETQVSLGESQRHCVGAERADAKLPHCMVPFFGLEKIKLKGRRADEWLPMLAMGKCDSTRGRG